MYCPNCGVTYSNKIDRCPACGAPAPVVHKPKHYAGTTIMLIIAAFIGAYYLYCLHRNIYGGMSDGGLGLMLAQTLIMPHMAAVFIAVILNIFACLALSRGLSLASAILYTIAIVSMPIAWANTVIPAVLCYIAFGTLGSK